MLLTVGFGAGFCVFWLLITNIHFEMINFQALQPVLNLQMDITENGTIVFPFAVEGTGLVAHRVAVYDGPFFEDGSGREVMNVAALHIYNASEFNIDNARVVLKRGEERYVFYVEMLPAGASVLVPEQTGKIYKPGSYSACYGCEQLSKYPWDIAEKFQIDEVSMGELAIANLTGSELTDIRLYYKNYLSQDHLFIGGRAFCVSVESIRPGQSVTLSPEYFASGYSKWICVGAK